ncbi:hypothetical protein A3Q56_00973 [Intoshia linei]|uniref:Tudor domain-containing protein n=1 Tax=Intoshia linei TaxID=1819745 RepID=A0A177BAP8_9BILA|nr:hypothetical protein A3Q56_00973 [Intoshia linei]
MEKLSPMLIFVLNGIMKRLDYNNNLLEKYKQLHQTDLDLAKYGFKDENDLLNALNNQKCPQETIQKDSLNTSHTNAKQESCTSLKNVSMVETALKEPVNMEEPNSMKNKNVEFKSCNTHLKDGSIIESTQKESSTPKMENENVESKSSDFSFKDISIVESKKTEESNVSTEDEKLDYNIENIKANFKTQDLTSTFCVSPYSHWITNNRKLTKVNLMITNYFKKNKHLLATSEVNKSMIYMTEYNGSVMRIRILQHLPHIKEYVSFCVDYGYVILCQLKQIYKCSLINEDPLASHLELKNLL